MWNLQEFWKLSRQPWWPCHASVFHLCRLCSPTFWTLHLWSRLSARPPPLSPLLFTLSIDTPPPPLPLSLCFTGGGWLSLPPGLAITRKPLVNCSFWFLPNVPRPDLHLLHISLPNSQVALCSSFHFSSGFTVAYEHMSQSWCCCFFSPYSGHSCLEAHHHYRLSSFFTIFTFKPEYMVSFLISALLEYLNFFLFFIFLHKIQKHYMIFTGQHYVARRKYVGSLKMWLCGLLELHQITGIIKLSFLTLAVCYPPTLDFHVRVCI